jgi:CRP-like cAMP-binding protein
VIPEAPNKLPPGLWSALEGIRSVQTYTKGKTLFQYGVPSQGVFLVERGQVDLLLPTARGERFFEKTGPGVMLGLSETMCGDVYKLTAQAAMDTEVSFVSREALLNFLRQHQGFCMQIVRLLSENLHLLYYRYRCISGIPARSRRNRQSGSEDSRRAS